MVEAGDLDFEGIHLQDALLYIRMNTGLLDRDDLELLEEYLPERKFQGQGLTLLLRNSG